MRRLRSHGEDDGGALGAGALAPLVDLLTLLTLFLLRAFSTDPPVDVGELGFDLARSASEQEAPRRLALDVGEGAIWLGGRRVVGTAYYATSDEVLVREVYDRLLQRGGEALDLRVDADVPYAVVRKLLHTAREAGVKDVALVAASRSGL